MTNFEYLLENEKELVKESLSTKDAKFAIDEKNKIRNCNDISCAECKFNKGSCIEEIRAWLNVEYEEPLPKTVMISRDTPKHTPVWVKDFEHNPWTLKFFSHFSLAGYPICFANGCFDGGGINSWTYAKPFIMGVNPNEDEKEAEE